MPSKLDPKVVESIRERLDSFAKLEGGWFDGSPDNKHFSSEGLDWFETTLVQMMEEYDLPKPYIYPTPEGRVRLEWDFGPAGSWDVSAEFDLEMQDATIHGCNIHTDEEAPATFPCLVQFNNDYASKEFADAIAAYRKWADKP